MTEKLYETDADMREFEAMVEAVVRWEKESGLSELILDKTAFYPTGGGQPNDTGLLRWEGGTVKVMDVRKKGDDVIHVVEGDPPETGTHVIGVIDWDRRYMHMRYHTLVHAAAALAWEMFGTSVVGGQIDVKKARLDFEFREYDKSYKEKLEAALKEVVEKDLPVSVSFMPREEALSRPELIKTKINLLPLNIDPVRIVSIKDLDIQADGGTHVRSTSEIGKVRIGKVESKGRGIRRFTFVIEGDGGE